MNPYTLRNHLTLLDANTAISREDFENNFRRTAEHVTFTFNGWEGASYNGETRTARVYRTTVKGYEDVLFIKDIPLAAAMAVKQSMEHPARSM